MALAEDLRLLRERVLGELIAAHDYYVATKIAWRIVEKVIQAGNSLTIRNGVTGTVITQAKLTTKAPGYVSGELAEATF